MTISITNSRDSKLDMPIVFGVITFFALLSGLIFYQLLPILNFSQNAVFPFARNESVYLLYSKETEKYLIKGNGSADSYKKIINNFAKRLKKVGIETKMVSEDALGQLPARSLLIALDTYVLSDINFEKIKSFVKKGGKLFFNYRFGYFGNSDGRPFDSYKRVRAITNLKFMDKSLSKEENGAFFMIQKSLSPIGAIKSVPTRNDLILYDPLPIFDSNGNSGDILLSNWEVTSTPKVHSKKLKLSQAAVAWHGNYGRGSWYYFSFPAYSFIELRGEKIFDSIVGSAVRFLREPFWVVPYPFLDCSKAIFISEDTEYKYRNMYGYSMLARKYDINTTLFCVGKYAEKNTELTKEISKLPNVEIGSHSYSHTKIMGTSKEKMTKEIDFSKKLLEKITGKKVLGFRPPREEIDKAMALRMKESGYGYTMEHTKTFLLPTMEHEGFITIPRHGTDDFQYFVKMGSSDKEILESMKFETEMLSSMNILYTLSVHTHIMSAPKNLHILKSYFDYLKRHDELVTLKGKDLAYRANTLSGIKITTEMTTRNIILNIENRNKHKVKNFKFRLYWHNMKSVGSLKAEMLKTQAKVIAKNKKERYSDISIKTLSPNSSITLMLNYEK